MTNLMISHLLKSSVLPKDLTIPEKKTGEVKEILSGNSRQNKASPLEILQNCVSPFGNSTKLLNS